MLGDTHVAPDRGDDRYPRRVLRALDGRRVGAAALVTLLLSAEALSSAQLDFFSPGEIGLLWLELVAELAVLAAALTIAYTLVDEALWQKPPRLRLAIACVMLFVLSAVLTVLLYGYYAHGFDQLPAFTRPARQFAALRPAGNRSGPYRRGPSSSVANRFRRARRGNVAGPIGTRRVRAAIGAAAGPDRAALSVQRAGQRAAALSHSTPRRVGNDHQPDALLARSVAAAPHAQCIAGEELELVRAYLDLLQVRMARA
jgi:hypothetical protein